MFVYYVLLNTLVASKVVVSISVVCTMYPYAWVGAVFIVCWMRCGSSSVSDFEFATMYMFRLYFLGRVPAVCVCVRGNVILFGMQLICRLRVRYGVCFKSGSISFDALDCVYLCVCMCIVYVLF